MQRFAAIALAALLLAPIASAEPRGTRVTYKARVVGISDGDTIRVLREEGGKKSEEKIRLHGIDCPESGQPFGSAAKRATSELAFDEVGR